MEIVNGTTCYTCGNAGQITKSTDGGKTFERVTSFGGEVPNECKMMSFCDENTGIIASEKRLGLTVDGAATWTELTPPAELIAIRMLDAKTFLCVGNDFLLYKTADGGTTWSSVPLGLPLGREYSDKARDTMLFADGENAYTIYCLEKESMRLKSYSTTDNWTSCNENPLPELTLPEGVLYLSPDGSILTLTDTKNDKATAIRRES